MALLHQPCSLIHLTEHPDDVFLTSSSSPHPELSSPPLTHPWMSAPCSENQLRSSLESSPRLLKLSADCGQMVVSFLFKPGPPFACSRPMIICRAHDLPWMDTLNVINVRIRCSEQAQQDSRPGSWTVCVAGPPPQLPNATDNVSQVTGRARTEKGGSEWATLPGSSGKT